VKKDAKADEIKKSYRRLARKFHPGRKSEETRRPEENSRTFRKLTTFFPDEKKRKVFDKFGLSTTTISIPIRRFASGCECGSWSTGLRTFRDFSGDTSTTGGGSSFRDIFSDLFGGGGGAGTRAQRP
jgi:DnaJ-class molecular chaperone